MIKKWQKRIDVAIGPLYLVASEDALHGVHWQEQRAPFQDNAILEEAKRQIEQYFKGERVGFTLPLNAQGTSFQKQVWAELLNIPCGQTRSYEEIAQALNKPKACRAVGSANGKNPLSIIVPCHRVIAKDGTLGGYAGGLDIKRYLLKLEQKRLSCQHAVTSFIPYL